MAAKIRLLHVLEATVGGTRRHLLDLCGGLPADRFLQHVVYSSVRNPGFEADARLLREAGIETTPLPLRRRIEPVEDWHCLCALTRLMRDWRPEVLHGHSSKGGFLARLAGRRLPGVRTVYNPHGFAFQMRTSTFTHALYIALERLAGGYTDALVAACESQRSLALRYGLLPPERIEVIPNGICAESYASPGGSALREELGIPATARLVGTVAALSPQKGIKGLLKAAATVAAERPGTRFLVAGDGPLRPSLQRQLEPLGLEGVVTFAGLRADIPAVLAALDLFVLPSLWEGLPYALLEAGAAGLPVVASAVPGNVDLVRPGETGWLAAAGDDRDLAKQLLAALDDPDAGHKAANLRELVRREYSLRRMVDGHADLYERLVRQ